MIPERTIVIAGEMRRGLFPQTLADLIAASSEAAFAVAQVRLTALEGLAQILSRVQHCRLVLARFDASGLELPDDICAERHERLALLLDCARSGSIEVRSAGATRWQPDFSVFRLKGADHFNVCLLGAHYLLPFHDVDWPLTCLCTDVRAVQRAHGHFDSLWQASHDVRPAVLATLEDALCR